MGDPGPQAYPGMRPSQNQGQRDGTVSRKKEREEEGKVLGKEEGEEGEVQAALALPCPFLGPRGPGD